MPKFRVFVQDVGNNGYSGLRDIEAETLRDAAGKFVTLMPGRYIILPHARRELWPDGQTGALSVAAQAVGAVSIVHPRRGPRRKGRP